MVLGQASHEAADKVVAEASEGLTKAEGPLPRWLPLVVMGKGLQFLWLLEGGPGSSPHEPLFKAALICS